jgi:hypothetical protein
MLLHFSLRVCFKCAILPLQLLLQHVKSSVTDYCTACACIFALSGTDGTVMYIHMCVLTWHVL